MLINNMDELTKAKKRALILLTDMDRTEKELRDRLKKAGYSEDTIARTMEYVRSFGYIDDRKYAEKFIDFAKGKKSRVRIAYDLQQKGVPRDVIDEAFESAEEWDEKNLIRTLAEKKLRSMDTSDPASYTKVASYLARKGFTSPERDSRDLISWLFWRISGLLNVMMYTRNDLHRMTRKFRRAVLSSVCGAKHPSS